MKSEYCQRGHQDWLMNRKNRYCRTCRIEGVRKRRGQIPLTEYLFKRSEQKNSSICPNGHEGRYILNDRARCKTCEEDYYRHLRMEVLLTYGAKCLCCDEWRYEFLDIDHINGDGKEHRKSLGRRNICNWLKEHDYPEGFRVLCSSCNQSLGRYGYCPHLNASTPG